MTSRSKHDYLYVGIQMILFLVYAISPFDSFNIHLPIWLIYLSLVISILGLIFVCMALIQLKTNLTPWPTPKSDAYLVQNGTYQLARHPIYAGLILCLVAYAMYEQSMIKLAISGALILLFYYKSKYEESLLLIKYPEYNDYKQKVGRFWPKIF
ncbi:MAG: isoprenylcysteine carboxylmethyltransferase family protein [Saprospiraceae bacterium]|nr:isoprenylcysteine carboxylmethyltransferase family protein [Saprospiraceae bacterium]